MWRGIPDLVLILLRYLLFFESMLGAYVAGLNAEIFSTAHNYFITCHCFERWGLAAFGSSMDYPALVTRRVSGF